MPLTLRPTGLSGNPHRNDWSIHSRSAGSTRTHRRACQKPLVLVDHGDGAGAVPRAHWHRAATLEAAKADFQVAWEAFKAANAVR